MILRNWNYSYISPWITLFTTNSCNIFTCTVIYLTLWQIEWIITRNISFSDAIVSVSATTANDCEAGFGFTVAPYVTTARQCVCLSAFRDIGYRDFSDNRTRKHIKRLYQRLELRLDGLHKRINRSVSFHTHTHNS